MRKNRILFVSIVSMLICFNIGCQKSNMYNNTPSDNSYMNIAFENNFIVDSPNIDSFETFELKRKSDLSGQELYTRFDETVEKYFPNIFSNEEKKNLYKINGIDYNGNFLEGNFIENKDKIMNGEVPVPSLWFTSEKAMVQMEANGATQTITGSVAYNLDNPDTDTIGMYCAADSNEIVEKIHITTSGFENDMEYNLFNGNVKIKDAIDYTESFLNNEFDNGIANPDLIADITDAWIVDMGNGIYGYHFWLTSTYNDIRFDIFPMKEAMGFSHDMSTCKPYDIYPGYAFMIENDKLDSIMAFGYKRAYNIENIQSHNMKITFDDAAKILSDSISDIASMKISRAEFVYTPYQENESDNTQLNVEAAWKFSAINQNDNLGYIFYVNAVTGEVDYYTY